MSALAVNVLVLCVQVRECEFEYNTYLQKRHSLSIFTANTYIQKVQGRCSDCLLFSSVFCLSKSFDRSCDETNNSQLGKLTQCKDIFQSCVDLKCSLLSLILHFSISNGKKWVYLNHLSITNEIISDWTNTNGFDFLGKIGSNFSELLSFMVLCKCIFSIVEHDSYHINCTLHMLWNYINKEVKNTLSCWIRIDSVFVKNYFK